MTLDECLDDSPDDFTDDFMAEMKPDLKRVAEQLDAAMARVLDEAALNPDDPRSYIVLRMALASFTKLRLSAREQAMIAGDTAAYFEKIATKLADDMRNTPSFLH